MNNSKKKYVIAFWIAVAMIIASVITFFLKFPKDEKENG